MVAYPLVSSAGASGAARPAATRFPSQFSVIDIIPISGFGKRNLRGFMGIFDRAQKTGERPSGD
jgi:hypothetical protein